jgi:hypothetical protein
MSANLRYDSVCTVCASVLGNTHLRYDGVRTVCASVLENTPEVRWCAHCVGECASMCTTAVQRVQVRVCVQAHAVTVYVCECARDSKPEVR